MNTNEILEEYTMIFHDSHQDTIQIKEWIAIQLSLHKRKESVSQWLSDMKINFDLYKRLSDLSEAEWIGLQYLTASLNDPCVIYDSYDRYTVEEVMAINRIVKRIADQKAIQILSDDNRILYSESTSVGYIKISLSCRGFKAQKYLRMADIYQEGDQVFCYFENREKALRFLNKCLSQEDVYYVEMRTCYEKACI